MKNKQTSVCLGLLGIRKPRGKANSFVSNVLKISKCQSLFFRQTHLFTESSVLVLKAAYKTQYLSTLFATEASVFWSKISRETTDTGHTPTQALLHNIITFLKIPQRWIDFFNFSFMPSIKVHHWGSHTVDLDISTQWIIHLLIT